MRAYRIDSRMLMISTKPRLRLMIGAKYAGSDRTLRSGGEVGTLLQLQLPVRTAMGEAEA